MSSALYADLIECLMREDPPRVPSLLVTVFGELAQAQGTRIGTPVLGRLMEVLRVRPEAMRVALHRLRKDDWIEAERHGRTSSYALTAHGRAESAVATPLIYSNAPGARAAWLVVTDPAQARTTDPQGGVWVGPQVLVTARPPHDDAAHVTPLGADATLPLWMRGKICDPAVAAMSDRLANRLADVRAADGCGDGSALWPG